MRLALLFLVGVIIACGTVEAPTFQSLPQKKCLTNQCLAVNYISYEINGLPVVTRADASTALAIADNIYASCGLSFLLETYGLKRPESFGLLPYPAWDAEFDIIRNIFVRPDSFLIVATGSWQRTHDITHDGWARMPGGEPLGVIISGNLGANGIVVAHELGHYLSLDHVKDPENVMNPVVFPTSIHITPSQCEQAHRAILRYWQRVLR